MNKEYHHSLVNEIMERFLEFEDKSSVLNYHYQYRNMLIWPFIRVVVLDSIIKSYCNGKGGLIDNVSQSMKKHKVFSYRWIQILKLKKNSLFCHKRKDIIFIYSAIANIKDDAGKYYNRVYDDFVGMHKNTAIIETAPLFKHLYPKKYETYESDSLDIICMFSERLTNLNGADKITIDTFIDYLQLELPFQINDDYWRAIRFELERYAKNNKLIYQFYEKSFRNMHPKLVFIEEGCYGNHTACINKVLHDLGIPCAEIQHGDVFLSHMAYNYSNIIFDSKEYQEYMPDTFLAMGRYWLDQVRLPIKKESLGSANFERIRRRIGTKRASNKILVLPTENTQAWVDLVQYIGKNIANGDIIVKIHPLLQAQYDKFNKVCSDQKNIAVYAEGNIYDYLEQSNIVIGDCSTVLYEAAALNKTVLIWNNELSAAHIDFRLGYWFEDKYELCKIIQNSTFEKNENMINSEDIFAYDVGANYSRFIKKNL